MRGQTERGAMMDQAERRSFQAPDETREFPHGRAEILKAGGGEAGRLVFRPGWRRSRDGKPIHCQGGAS